MSRLNAYCMQHSAYFVREAAVCTKSMRFGLTCMLSFGTYCSLITLPLELKKQAVGGVTGRQISPYYPVCLSSPYVTT